MRTTVDLPDEVYRRLKVRAGLGGISMKDLLVSLVESGLRAAAAPALRRPAPPVLVPPSGDPVRALTARELRRLEEREDEARGG